MITRIKNLIKELLFLFKERKKIIGLIKRQNGFSTRHLEIGKNLQINDFAIIRNQGGKLKIGNNFTLGIGANLLTYGGSIRIGDNSLVNNYSIVYGHGGIEIGDNTQIAANCTIIPANHNFSFLEIPVMYQGETRKGIRIGNNVWIGANSVILDGVQIGDNSIIGAGSVVTRSIPENCIAYGNPARIIKERKGFVVKNDLNKINLSIINYVYRQEKDKYKEIIQRILNFDHNQINFIAEEERAFPSDEKFIKSGYSEIMLKRYFFAGKMFCENRLVLDSCCGIGWGSAILSKYSKNVTSFDIDEKTIAFCKQFWKLDNVNFIEGSALDINFLNQSKFDTVTAFETIEHFSKEDGEKYICQMTKVLKKNGVLIGTSAFPETDSEAKKLRLTNPYHLHIFTEKELRGILQKYFSTYHIIDQWMFIAIK